MKISAVPIKILILTSLLLLCSGCSYPVASVEKAEWGGYDTDTNELSSNFHLSIQNDNPVSLPVDKMNYSFKMFDIDLFNGETNLDKTIEAEAVTPIFLPVKMTLIRAGEIAVLMFKKKVWPWQIGGTFSVPIPIYPIEIPFNRAGTWQRPALLDSFGEGAGEMLETGLDFVKGWMNKDKK